jgi:raffinose/stachyose/melibiose transport system permease protein
VGFVGTWLNVGLCLVLFLSGVGNVQPELFEAARLDGASGLQEFFGITLPALRGQITVALTLTVVSSLKTFDLVYITTRGGPGNSTSVPAFEAYNRAFNSGQVGSAASVAVVLTIGILLITALIGRLQPKDTE